MKEIPLGWRAKKHTGMVAVVDDEDYEELMQYAWYAFYNKCAGTYYARRKRGDIIVSMHREILRTPKGFETDHINHNTLDNR